MNLTCLAVPSMSQISSCPNPCTGCFFSLEQFPWPPHLHLTHAYSPFWAQYKHHMLSDLLLTHTGPWAFRRVPCPKAGIVVCFVPSCIPDAWNSAWHTVDVQEVSIKWLHGLNWMNTENSLCLLVPWPGFYAILHSRWLWEARSSNFLDANKVVDECKGSRFRPIWLWISALTLPSCVTMGRALPLSEPQFSHFSQL